MKLQQAACIVVVFGWLACSSGARLLQQARDVRTFEGAVVPMPNGEKWISFGTDSLGLAFTAGVPAPTLTAGMRVKVTGYIQGMYLYVTKPVQITLNGAGSVYQAQQASVGANGNTIQPASGDLNTLVFVLKLCDHGPNVNRQSLDDSLFGTDNAPASQFSVKNYMAQCSFGEMGMSRSKTRVTDDIPIRGAACALRNDLCGDQALQAAAKEAEVYARNVLKINIDNYAHHVMLVPQDTPSCSLLGIADQGCGSSTCRMFLRTGANLNVRAFVHEMGHLLGLGHSTMNGQEYGDASCPMGSGVACYNSYHSSLLSWTSPVAELEDGRLTADEWHTYTLPAKASNSRNYLKITHPTNTVFLAFSAPTGIEQSMPANLRNRVLINAKDKSDTTKSALLSILAPSQTWSLAGSGFPTIYVRFSTQPGLKAAVSICKAVNARQCKTDPNLVQALPEGDGDPSPPPAQEDEEAPSPSPSPDVPEVVDENVGFEASSSSSSSGDVNATSTTSGGASTTTGGADDTSTTSTNGTEPVVCDTTPQCGDGKCDAWAGENCVTCPGDCNRRTVTGQAFCCGGGDAGDGCGAGVFAAACAQSRRECRASCPA